MSSCPICFCDPLENKIVYSVEINNNLNKFNNFKTNDICQKR
jgi:hypothetical protein